MGATISQIRTAMLGALRTLSTDNGGPFEHVGNFRGEVTQRYGVDRETLGAGTAALLALEGESPEDKQSVDTLVKSPASTVLKGVWRVYVVDQTMRETDAELLGDDTSPGTDDLTDAVIGALDGLVIPAPAATLTVSLTGAPGAVVTFAATDRLASPDGTQYAPVPASVTLDGTGTVACAFGTATPGRLGEQAPGTTLTWVATPAGLAATSKVSAIAVRASNGLLRSSSVDCIGHKPHVVLPGQSSTHLVRLQTLRVAPMRTPYVPGVPLVQTTGNVHLTGTTDTGADPIVQLAAVIP